MLVEVLLTVTDTHSVDPGRPGGTRKKETWFKKLSLNLIIVMWIGSPFFQTFCRIPAGHWTNI